MLNNKLTTNYNKGLDYYSELICFIYYKNSVEGDDYYDGFDPTYKDKINAWGI